MRSLAHIIDVLTTAVRVKNFDRSIEGTLHLYNLKGIHFKPQTRLALADVKVIISMPDAFTLDTTGHH